jgi:CRP-like cAMP-binding protein
MSRNHSSTNPTSALETIQQTFPTASADAWKQLADVHILREYPAGSVLFLQGKPAQGIYVIRSGRVEVTISADDQQLLLRVAGPGTVLGAGPTLNGRDHDTTARAAQAVELLFFPRPELLKVIGQFPAICLDLAQVINADLDAAYEGLRFLRGRRRTSFSQYQQTHV